MKAWRREGFRVVEGYPGGSQDLLGLPRKQQGTRLLQAALRARGLGGAVRTGELTHDELDAVTIAWVGDMFLRGRGHEIGDADEGTMILPKPRGPNARPAPRGELPLPSR